VKHPSWKPLLAPRKGTREPLSGIYLSKTPVFKAAREKQNIALEQRRHLPLMRTL